MLGCLSANSFIVRVISGLYAFDLSVPGRRNHNPLMKAEPITRIRVDELLRFLPLLSTPSKELEPKWQGLHSESDKDGSTPMPYPVYPPIVVEFFRLAAQPFWNDFEYVPEVVNKMIRNDDVIASASLPQIKTMLTFCVRGERFCDGHWAALIREGRIEAILLRLDQLRESVK